MWPLVSICIPSYRQPELLKRALHSISGQDYKYLEIIISDDTPDNSVKKIVDDFSDQLQIFYYHNILPLGSPRNWNMALDKANGELVMLLHHDDWFAHPNTLTQCVKLFIQNPEASLLFGRSITLKKIFKSRKPPPNYFLRIYNDPLKLFLCNVIGPPSNVILRNTVKLRYDSNYKWLVDLEYYIRIIKAGYKFIYLDEELIFIGIHDDQMTNFCKADGNIIVKENLLFLNEYYSNKLNLKVYDHIWRLLRNNKIRNDDDIIKIGLCNEQISPIISKMLKIQRSVPAFALKIGIISKVLMFISYL